LDSISKLWSPIFGFLEGNITKIFFSLAHQQEPTYNKEENSTLYLLHHPRFFSVSKILKKCYLILEIIIILRPYVEYFTVKKFPSFSVFNFRKKNKKIFIYVCFYKIFYRLIKNILQLIFKLNLFFLKYIQFMILCKIFF
jgi:hypothetical protein